MSILYLIFPIIFLSFGLGFVAAAYLVDKKRITLKITLLILNIFIAFFALISTIVATKDILNKQSTKKDKIRDWWSIIVAALIMGLTIWNSFIQSSNEKADWREKKSLHADVKTIQSKLDSQIKNDKEFEIWLKDTFGIKRQGDTAIIYNTNIYFSQINQGQKEKPDLYPDSINYGFLLLHNKDTLILYPKNGVWVKPFLSFDAKLDKVNGGVYQADGMGKPYSTKSGPSEITNVNGKNYKTISVFLDIVRSKSYPLIIDMKGDKNQYIIFGDSADPNKRYIYQKDKVRWIPIR